MFTMRGRRTKMSTNIRFDPFPRTGPSGLDDNARILVWVPSKWHASFEGTRELQAAMNEGGESCEFLVFLARVVFIHNRRDLVW